MLPYGLGLCIGACLTGIAIALMNNEYMYRKFFQILPGSDKDLNLLFEKIKNLMINNKIYYPCINEIKINSMCDAQDCTILAINKKIRELETKIIKEYYPGPTLTNALNFLREFKIMKIIYDNFFENNIIKSNSAIIFYDSWWYEISAKIKHLAIINNDNINLDNLESTVEELTIVNVKNKLTNLPSNLKKLYLYNLHTSFDIKTVKIPMTCEMFVETCPINKENIFYVK